MKKIIYTFIISFSFLYADYDPFIYHYETEEIKKTKEANLKKLEESKIEKENIEITIKKSNEVKEVIDLIVNNDEELDQQFFNELNKIKKIKSFKEKKVVETESIDGLLDNIKFFDETADISTKNDTINNNSINNIPDIKEQNLIVDFDKKKKYILLYEDKNVKHIKNKLIINNINNGYILKSNKLNNIFGVIIDSSLYNMNKINILYKDSKVISIDEIKLNYETSKNHLN